MEEHVFKTAWFAKASRKARISDEELCAAVRQTILGQADDLGGGVFTKRLGKNLYRSLILAKAIDVGYTPISSPRKIAPTLKRRNL